MIRVADEVREALAVGGAVVALETTLVAHGFPPGEGVEVGLESERQVRAAGATPATVGVLDGEVHVGLTEDELGRFGPFARKVGPRDLAVEDADSRGNGAGRTHLPLRLETHLDALAGREAVRDERRLERDDRAARLERALDFGRDDDAHGVAASFSMQRAAAASAVSAPPTR